MKISIMILLIMYVSLGNAEIPIITATKSKSIAKGIVYECGDVKQLIIKATKTIFYKNMVFSLKRKKITNYILFISNLDKRIKLSQKGVFRPWRLLARKGLSSKYCVVGKGEWVEITRSAHQGSNTKNKYDLNVPGKLRCSNKDNIFSTLRLRLGANRSLGKAFIYHLWSDDEKHNYTFLSGYNLKWILLRRHKYPKGNSVMCYKAKGDDMSLRKNLSGI